MTKDEILAQHEHQDALKLHINAMAEMIASGKASEDHPAFVAAKPFIETLNESQLAGFHQAIHRQARKLSA